MKRKIFAVAGAVMASAVMSVCVSAANISIVIDNNTVESDVEPQITAEGRTIVPLRVISEELGAKVDWDAETKTVTVEKADSTLKLTIGDRKMSTNDGEIQLDSPAQIVNDRTMVPLRAISESFGCKVDWDGETKTVIIDTASEETPEEVSETSEKTYKSDDGWSLKYDSSLVDVKENGDSVELVYTDETAGDAKVTLSYIKGKMPQDVLDEKTAGTDSKKMTDREGFFADSWAFTREIEAEAGSDDYSGFIATEYNGGTLLVQIESHGGAESDENDTTLSDVIANIVDSVALENAQPQTQFANVPGVYTRTYTDKVDGKEIELTETVTLDEEHYAKLSFRDEMEGAWRSGDILVNNYETAYEYKISGDKLSLNIDGEWIEFTREGKKAGEEKPSVVEKDAAAYDTVISELKKGESYAFADIDSENDALLTTDYTYDNLDGNRATIKATVYGFDKNGSLVNYGDVKSSGTAYPLSAKDGYLYVAGKINVTKYYIDESKSEFVKAEEAYGKFDKDGNVTYYYGKDGKEAKEAKDDTELTRLFDEYMNAVIINFTEAE